ncbi:SCP2 sterol-binding domain-containing protein [Candidatus Methanomassiliicoccus intestinalis]|uniref:SCP-2 sterol transfer family protein n=1 Tax=Methanomassiliicoccus intestinalis (strain Issoire-Mx1) TaxID=1295009 RepID=R9T828_METII|nr:SCP2 sterol-binding domain-containing protein [Candidatus Methanomassiliicoccus intestinalis]AGN25791.1 SCP-2 sterol transfer family protein [Candidatus Methanomassiliicoccus intestinalis Issoire-Mx1]
MSVEPMIQELIDKFNTKVDSDEKLRDELKGLSKTAFIDLGDEKYNFTLKDEHIQNFSAGEIENPDVTITSDPETFMGVMEGKIKPMKAFALRKVKIKGDISDIMSLRKLF